MHRAAACLLAFALALPASAARFPRAVTLPDLPLARGGVEVRPYAQEEFIMRDTNQVLGGRLWLAYIDYQDKWGEDRRDALAGIVHELQKGGWEVLFRDEPAVPPLATLKHRARDGSELWARVEVFELARIAVLEPGPPPS